MATEIRKTKRIKLLVDFSRSWERGILKGISRYSHLYGPWSFVTGYVHYRRTGKNSVLSDWLVDGIIAIQDDLGDIKKAVELGIPAIVVGIHKEIEDLPTVTSNDFKIGKMGAEYFLEKKFTNYAYCGYENVYWSLNRRASFCETIEQAGFHVAVFKTEEKPVNFAVETLVLSEWLMSLPKPVAIMACNDDRSYDIVQACITSNLKIPEDVAILGVDDDPMVCQFSDLPLSSISVSTEKAGYEMAELLDNMLKHKKIRTNQIKVEPLYIQTRRSTDIFAVEDFEVACGIRFIKEHVREKISVNQVVDQMCLPRRTSEKRFKAVTGMPINEMILKERVNLAARLLLETNLTVEMIAKSVGYSTASYMIKHFRKFKKTTPLAYRQAHLTP